MNTITFMTANYVARETDYAMRDWGHGHYSTEDAFAPVETFPERFDALIAEVHALGFRAIDLWSAHLSPEWASDAHIEGALAALVRHGVSLASYATGINLANAEQVCSVASALGAPVVTGPFAGDVEALAPVLERHAVRLGIENHPERTPTELLDKITRGGPMVGATVDTGWWGTHRYDPAQAIEELAGTILHVHLKDVLAHGAHETCRWGAGVVPIDACVRTLLRLGYDGPLSVEHVPSTFDPSDELRAMRTELEGWLS